MISVGVNVTCFSILSKKWIEIEESATKRPSLILVSLLTKKMYI